MKTKTYTYNEITMTAEEWAGALGITKDGFRKRVLKYGIKYAVESPISHTGRHPKKIKPKSHDIAEPEPFDKDLEIKRRAKNLVALYGKESAEVKARML